MLLDRGIEPMIPTLQTGQKNPDPTKNMLGTRLASAVSAFVESSGRHSMACHECATLHSNRFAKTENL
jgi:hypothetical protein